MSTKIFWSPSSQDLNIGVLPGYVEETTCNRIVDASIAASRRQGTYDNLRNYPSEVYSDHRKHSNAWGAKYHICTHTNAGTGKETGTNIGCYDPTNTNLESTKLANFFANMIREAFPGRSVKVVKYTFDEVRRTNATCIYFEWGFHDNPVDCQWILDNIKKIGELQVKGIVAWQGKTWVPDSSEVAPVITPSVPATPTPTVPTYHLINLANTSADGTGRIVKLQGPEVHLIKTVPGSKFPYGLSYTGGTRVDAWFPEGSFE